MMPRPVAHAWRSLTGTALPAGDRRPVVGPGIELELVGAVPGALVRVAPAALVAVCAALVGHGPVVWVAAAAAVVAVLWRPDQPVPSLVALGAALGVYGGGDHLGGGSTDSGGLLKMSALVLALHLLLRVTGLAAHVAWRGVVERAVLGRVARSVLGVQVVVQGLLLAVVWLRGAGGLTAGHEWLRVVAVGAAVAVMLLVVPRSWLVRRRRPPG